MRQDGRSVFDEGFQIFRRPIDSLEVVLGFDGGNVEGAIMTEKKSAAAVVLIPEPSRRQNGALYKTTSLADASLPIRFSDVAPGRYKLFAFEVENSGASIPFRDPDFLSLHEIRGVSVTVEKGAAAGLLRVPLIPR